MAFRAGEDAQWENDQKGSGYTALCDQCNTVRGGRWYVPEFQEWAYLGAEVVNGLRDEPRLDLVEAVHLTVSRRYPSRFVKQVVLMLLAINPAEFGDEHQALRDFILTREATGLPNRYRLYLGLYDRDAARHAGLYWPMHFGADGITGFGATDILYPPYSYTLTIDEPTPSTGGCEITHLAEIGYDEQQDLSLRLPYNWTLLPHDIAEPDKPG